MGSCVWTDRVNTVRPRDRVHKAALKICYSPKTELEPSYVPTNKTSVAILAQAQLSQLKFSCHFQAMIRGEKRKCATCKQSAADYCLAGLCGKCCWPRCAPDTHNRREVERGSEGQPRRQFTRTLWHQARELADKHMIQDRFANSMWRAWDKDFESARKAITQGLLRMVDDDLDLSNDQLPEILRDSFSAAHVERIVRELRVVRLGPSPSPARASTWSDDTWPFVPDTQRVSVAAAPDGERATPAAALVDPVMASGSNDPVTVVVFESESSSSSTQSSSSVIWEGTLPCAMHVFAPGNVAPCKSDGTESAHYQRVWPALQALEKMPSSMDPLSSLLRARAAGKRILAQWIGLRPELDKRLFPAVEKPFEWFDSTKNNVTMEGIHDVGCWVYLQLRTPMPDYPVGTTTFLGRPVLHGNTFEEAVHGCSMHTVFNSVVKGLKPGTGTKNRCFGVFAFKTTSTPSVARSASQYCVYDTLCACPDHDIFFGPRMMLECALWKSTEAGIGKMSAGDNQLALKETCYHLKGVFVHILTPEDIRRLPDDHPARHQYTWCGRWNPRYEVGENIIEV